MKLKIPPEETSDLSQRGKKASPGSPSFDLDPPEVATEIPWKPERPVVWRNVERMGKQLNKGTVMKSKALVVMGTVFILTGCVVAGRRGGGVEVIPILPTVVELDVDGYYTYGGYHYFYDNDRWYYSTSRVGARVELPRSHWPRETRRRGWGHRN